MIKCRSLACTSCYTDRNGIKEYDDGLKVAYIGELACYKLIIKK